MKFLLSTIVCKLCSCYKELFKNWTGFKNFLVCLIDSSSVLFRTSVFFVQLNWFLSFFLPQAQIRVLIGYSERSFLLLLLLKAILRDLKSCWWIVWFLVSFAYWVLSFFLCMALRYGMIDAEHSLPLCYTEYCTTWNSAILLLFILYFFRYSILSSYVLILDWLRVYHNVILIVLASRLIRSK